MNRLFISFTLFASVLVFSLIVVSGNIYAQVPELISEEVIDETEEPVPININEPVEKVNSFELFWPLVAGKTNQDSLYFLKRLKEKIRGALIFGDSQKAEYEILLTTKRFLEAEKLMESGDVKGARKALEQAGEHIEEAREQWGEANEDGSAPKDQTDEINNKLENIEVFIPFLIIKYDGELETELDSLLRQIIILDNSV